MRCLLAIKGFQERIAIVRRHGDPAVAATAAGYSFATLASIDSSSMPGCLTKIRLGRTSNNACRSWSGQLASKKTNLDAEDVVKTREICMAATVAAS